MRWCVVAVAVAMGSGCGVGQEHDAARWGVRVELEGVSNKMHPGLNLSMLDDEYTGEARDWMVYVSLDTNSPDGGPSVPALGIVEQGIGGFRAQHEFELSPRGVAYHLAAGVMAVKLKELSAFVGTAYYVGVAPGVGNRRWVPRQATAGAVPIMVPVPAFATGRVRVTRPRIVTAATPDAELSLVTIVDEHAHKQGGATLGLLFGRQWSYPSAGAPALLSTGTVSIAAAGSFAFVRPDGATHIAVGRELGTAGFSLVLRDSAVTGLLALSYGNGSLESARAYLLPRACADAVVTNSSAAAENATVMWLRANLEPAELMLSPQTEALGISIPAGATSTVVILEFEVFA